MSAVLDRMREAAAALAAARAQAPVKAEPAVSAPATDAVVHRILAEWPNAVPTPGWGLIRATMKKTGYPVAFISGTLNRPTYKAIVEEAMQRSMDHAKVYVYGRFATYSGRGIEFMQYSEWQAELLQADEPAGDHGPVEANEHGHEFRRVLKPMVLHRSVSPEEWAAIQSTGSVAGGLNKFNPWDKRREVFFGAEPNEKLLHQGGERSRRAEYAVMNGKLQAALDACLKRIAQADGELLELAEELGFDAADEVPHGVRMTDPGWQRVAKKKTKLREREKAIRDEARDVTRAKMNALADQDEARGYEAVLLTTKPLAGARMYQGAHSGMGEDAEFGMESGAVTLADIDQVRYIKDRKLFDTPTVLDGVRGLSLEAIAHAGFAPESLSLVRDAEAELAAGRHHGHLKAHANGMRARCGGLSGGLGCITCRVEAMLMAEYDPVLDAVALEWKLFDGVVDISSALLDYVGSPVYQQLLADIETVQTALLTARGLERIKLSGKALVLAERIRRRQELQPVILQNRDRSTAASIAQVKSIGANPDPDLLGYNKTATEGAPIVFSDYDEFAGAMLLGRKATVTFTKDMSKVPVQFAVVSCDDVMVSHDFNGSTVSGYDDLEAPGKLRAVAGNGRAAGIQLAFAKGTADKYVEGLFSEADLLQLNAAAIADVTRPMLVRIMQHADVTADIGDKTNSSGMAGFSAVEQAKTDAARVDFDTLTFNDDGMPTIDALTRFVQAMPLAEQAALAPEGTPTNQAMDRLMAATFNRAYQNDDLVKLYSQSLDPEIKNVLFGMAQAAGDMAALAGHGDYDIRHFVTDAAEMASNAKRAGLPLSRMAEQRDINISELSNDIAGMFARNVRSAKKVGDALRNLARAALDTSDADDEDMFGPVEKMLPGELVSKHMGENG